MKDQRGVVYLETLVAFVPVFLFFLATLQIADLSAAHIIVRHAATVAARAAVVVLPDDGRYYNDENNELVHQPTELRLQDIEHAADLILRANPRLDRAPSNVQVGFPSGVPEASQTGGNPFKGMSQEQLLEAAFTSQTAGAVLNTSTKGNGEQGMRSQLDALVTARYRCLISALCPRHYTMVGSASLVYQGARYVYEAWPDSIRSEGDGRPESTPPATVRPPNGQGNPSQGPTDPHGSGPVASNSPGVNADAPVASDTPGTRPGVNGLGGSTSTSGPSASGSTASVVSGSRSGTNGSLAGNAQSASSNRGSGTATNSTDASRGPSGDAHPTIVARGPTDPSSPTLGRAGPAANSSSASNRSRDGAGSDSSADPSAQHGATTSQTSGSGRGTQGVISAAVADNDNGSPALPQADSTPSNAPANTAGIVASGSNGNSNSFNAATSGTHNLSELRAQLPSDVRNVPIVSDPNLTGNAVRVHYNYDARGRVTGVEIRVGPDAQPRHIADHVNTVRTLQTFQGLSGRVRLALAKLNAWIAGHPDVRPGSLAWETRREVEKLQAIIDARTRALDGQQLSERERSELESERAAYEAQLAQHEANLNSVTSEPGRGYVAAEDTGDHNDLSQTPYSSYFPGLSPADAARVDAFFSDKRGPDLTPTNPESPSQPPADLPQRLQTARDRSAEASAINSDGNGGQRPGTVAVGGVTLRNGWSGANQDATAFNMLYRALGLGLDPPGGQNDPRNDQGNLVQNKGKSKKKKKVTGAAAASHAEQLVALVDGFEGQNHPIGVSREQCGGCRAWFQEHAQRQQQTFVVADPEYTRVYYPNGEVSIYDANGTWLMSTSQPPSRGLANYQGIPW